MLLNTMKTQLTILLYGSLREQGRV